MTWRDDVYALLWFSVRGLGLGWDVDSLPWTNSARGVVGGETTCRSRLMKFCYVSIYRYVRMYQSKQAINQITESPKFS